MSEKALRFNEGKPELSYLLDIPKALEALVYVYRQGAVKYERGNWRKGGKPDEEYLDSALRHMMAYRNEGQYDPDIGTLHIANAAWNLLALLELNICTEHAVLDPDFDQEAFVAKYTQNQDQLRLNLPEIDLRNFHDVQVYVQEFWEK